ncbi:hypothetical protein [Cecembia rubra]|uniref:Uncharacterized protein n=1 Tax=Cecembia rubra TaxID=1485585 RepID=A0A2P8DRN0_9BACT|nr:hypothetical protein [Cecembia rubra]PSK99871.1 hypothetical protein CLV48_11661 [Cecembia rubra]
MKKSNNPKNCLLVFPKSFYHYSEYFKKALYENGFQVTVCNDEYPESTLGKIMGKLRIPHLLKLTLIEIKEKFLDGKSYDLVLIIKGRGISPELIQEMRKVSAKIVGFSFDSFKYLSAPIKWFKYVDTFYTFDYRDSEKFELPIVELFSSLSENNIEKKFSYQISAIVRNHSERLNYIDKVFSNLQIERKFIYIFEQNYFTFILNFIKSPILYLKYFKNISFKSLPYSEYMRVLRESNFTLDYAHPEQSGITIRCFEALDAQTKIITNNTYVSRYKYFNNSNTIIFEPNSNPVFLQEEFKRIENYIPEKHSRTIDHFIKKLIS